MNLFKKSILGFAALTLLPTLTLANNSKRYIIRDADLQRAEAAVHQGGGAVHKQLKYHRALISQMSPQLKEKLERDLPGIQIEEDVEVNLLGFQVAGKPGAIPLQPAQTTPWGISATGSTMAHATNRGAGVKVCIVDTGIQASHPDLSGQVVGGENFVVIKGKLDPNKWADDNGHGTHVAGTVAALDNSIGVIGVAPQADLLAMKVLNSRGSGYLSDVADGITSCVNHGAQVISMSLGSSSGADLLHQAIIDANNSGAIIVAAAGNESGPVSYPAVYPETIAVSAVDSEMNFASFSNYGSEVDFAAPGVGVLSTIKGSSYATYSGTSMATPHVSGIIALMLSSGSLGLVSEDIGLTPEQQGEGFLRADLTVNNK